VTDQFQSQLRALDSQIQALTAERTKLIQSALEARSPIKVGDLITWRPGKPPINKHRMLGRVDKISELDSKSLCYHVTYIRKDGSESTKMRVYPYHEPLLAIQTIGVPQP
jgi:hypothetical protein